MIEFIFCIYVLEYSMNVIQSPLKPQNAKEFDFDNSLGFSTYGRAILVKIKLF